MTGTRDPSTPSSTCRKCLFPMRNSGRWRGLRLAVKDIFDVAGYRTGCGNPRKFAGSHAASRTAPAVQTILDAGARFVGKTQTDELAFSLFGQNVHFPFPVNPAAPDRVTGGSSSRLGGGGRRRAGRHRHRLRHRRLDPRARRASAA